MKKIVLRALLPIVVASCAPQGSDSLTTQTSAVSADPKLIDAKVYFDTTDENKDYDTWVSILVSSDSGIVAWGEAGATEYKDWTTNIENLMANHVLKSRCTNLNAQIYITASGLVDNIKSHDVWRFNARVVLNFDDGTHIWLRSPDVIELHSRWTSAAQFVRFVPEAPPQTHTCPPGSVWKCDGCYKPSQACN